MAYAATENNVRRIKLRKYFEQMRQSLNLPPPPIRDCFVSVPVEDPKILALTGKPVPKPGVEFSFYAADNQTAQILGSLVTELCNKLDYEPGIELYLVKNGRKNMYETNFFLPEDIEKQLFDCLESNIFRVEMLKMQQGVEPESLPATKSNPRSR